MWTTLLDTAVPGPGRTPLAEARAAALSSPPGARDAVIRAARANAAG